MQVLIFEPDHTGHHLNHIRVLSTALLQLPGIRVTVALNASAPASQEFSTHLRSLVDKVTIDASYSSPHGSAIKTAVAKARDLRAAVRQHMPDHVFIPYADGLAQVAGAFGIRPWSKAGKNIEFEVLMMGGFTPREKRLFGRLKESASTWAVSRAPWNILHHINPIPFERLKEAGGRLGRICRLMPEPIDPAPLIDRADARRQLGIPEDGFYLGVSGMIDARKGVDKLIEALDAVPQAKLLLAGRLSDEIRLMLSGTYKPLVDAGRVLLIDRYITNDEFLLAFAATDLVCTLYPQHIGSASIAIRAAAAGKPVLAADVGWMGAIIPRFGLGTTCDASRVASIRESLTAAAAGSPTLEKSEALRRFLLFHTNQNYICAWTHRLRERLSLGPSKEEITWEWVKEAPKPS